MRHGWEEIGDFEMVVFLEKEDYLGDDGREILEGVIHFQEEPGKKIKWDDLSFLWNFVHYFLLIMPRFLLKFNSF